MYDTWVFLILYTVLTNFSNLMLFWWIVIHILHYNKAYVKQVVKFHCRFTCSTHCLSSESILRTSHQLCRGGSKISLISMYRYCIGTLYIGFFRYIDVVSVTNEILVIFRYFVILFLIFNINLKTNIWVTIWYVVTPHYVSINPKRKLRTSLTTLLAIMKHYE